MAEGGDDSDRTEQATPHKLSKAREQGQVASSREVGSAFAMVVGATAFAFYLPWAGKVAAGVLAGFFAHAAQLRPGSGDIKAALLETALQVGLPLLGLLATFMLAGVAATVAQGAFVWTTQPLTPQFSRVSPMAGAKRLFGPTTLIEFAKNLVKLGVVGAVAFVVLEPMLGELAALPELPLPALLQSITAVIAKLLFWVAGATIVLAGADWFIARQKFNRQMRMSKKEIADEHKEQDGDPHIKGKLKQLRAQRARNRMMSEVPKATVIVTNPTHYSIALRYDQGSPAPIVVAKGVDILAFKIREIAKEHDIPIVESPPLARALYKQVEIEHPIPVEHYQAVASIIAAIMRMRRPA